MRSPTIYLPDIADQEVLFWALWARGVRFSGGPTLNTQWTDWTASILDDGRVTFPWVVCIGRWSVGANSKPYHNMPTNSIRHFLECHARMRA